MNQKERIKKFLSAHGKITLIDALTLGIYRLSERIRELEAEGYKFKHGRIKGQTAFVGEYIYKGWSKPAPWKQVLPDEIRWIF